MLLYRRQRDDGRGGGRVAPRGGAGAPPPPPAVRAVTRSVSFEEEGTLLLNSYVLKLGDTVIVGCQPEICVKTARELKAALSPYRVILMEFVNGTADYMASRELYEKAAPQSKKGCFMPGAAELFVKEMAEQIR